MTHERTHTQSHEMPDFNMVVRRRWRRARQVAGLLAAALAVTAIIMFVAGAERAMTVLAALCLVMAVEVVLGLNERRIAVKCLSAADGEERQGERAGSARLRVGASVAVRIVFLGLFVSAITLDAKQFSAGALAVFLGIVLMGAPVWLAVVSDEESRVRKSS
ncbi:MAG: hypothetical protein ACO3IB_13180 [Phycisphaerales bacterium]